MPCTRCSAAPQDGVSSRGATVRQVFVEGVAGNTRVYLLSCGYVIWVSYGHRRVATRSADAPTRYSAHGCHARGALPLPRMASHGATARQLFVEGVTGNTRVYLLSCGYVIWVSYGHRRVATRSADAPTRYRGARMDAMHAVLRRSPGWRLTMPLYARYL